MKTDITPTDSVCPIFLEPIEPEQVESAQTARDARIKAEADAKANKEALLAKLGITADEAKLLLS
jgi:hypothetical protein